MSDEVKSKDFHVPVAQVLKGASEANLYNVVIIGEFTNGKMYVASSLGTPQTLNLIDKGEREIDSLT